MNAVQLFAGVFVQAKKDVQPNWARDTDYDTDYDAVVRYDIRCHTQGTLYLSVMVTKSG